MVHQIVLKYSSNYLDFVVVDSDISLSSVGSDSSSGPKESLRAIGWAGTIESAYY
jgi:hypothetical protein